MATPAAPPRAVAPAPAVPEGCDVNLGGAWTAEAGGGLRYEALDDGGSARLVAFVEAASDAGSALRRFSRARDGGLPWLVRDAGDRDEGPSATLVLVRTPSGFSGLASAFGEVPSGDAGCRPEFPVRVIACAPGRLELEARLSAPVDAECRLLDGGVVGRQVLLRAGSGADERQGRDGG
jgi:hypothetical protein